jgi:hypothetical protein
MTIVQNLLAVSEGIFSLLRRAGREFLPNRRWMSCRSGLFDYYPQKLWKTSLVIHSF